MPTSFGARDSGLRADRVFRHGRRRGQILVVSGFEFGVGQTKEQITTVSSPRLVAAISKNTQRRMPHVSRRRADAGDYPAHVRDRAFTSPTGAAGHV